MNHEILIGRFRVCTETLVSVYALPLSPAAPIISSIRFEFKKGLNMATGLVQFAAPPPSNVTSRVATIVETPAGSTTPNPPITLDYVANPAATFPATAGNSYSVTAVDSDVAGPSPASNTFVAVATPPPSPPVAPVITGIAFTFP